MWRQLLFVLAVVACSAAQTYTNHMDISDCGVYPQTDTTFYLTANISWTSPQWGVGGDNSVCLDFTGDNVELIGRDNIVHDITEDKYGWLVRFTKNIIIQDITLQGGRVALYGPNAESVIVKSTVFKDNGPVGSTDYGAIYRIDDDLLHFEIVDSTFDNVIGHSVPLYGSKIAALIFERNLMIDSCHVSGRGVQVSIKNNVFTGKNNIPDRNCIAVQGTNVEITDNVFHHLTKFGMLLAIQNVKETAVVRGNSFRHNSDVAAGVEMMCGSSCGDDSFSDCECQLSLIDNIFTNTTIQKTPIPNNSGSFLDLIHIESSNTVPALVSGNVIDGVFEPADGCAATVVIFNFFGTSKKINCGNIFNNTVRNIEFTNECSATDPAVTSRAATVNIMQLISTAHFNVTQFVVENVHMAHSYSTYESAIRGIFVDQFVTGLNNVFADIVMRNLKAGSRYNCDGVGCLDNSGTVVQGIHITNAARGSAFDIKNVTIDGLYGANAGNITGADDAQISNYKANGGRVMGFFYFFPDFTLSDMTIANVHGGKAGYINGVLTAECSNDGDAWVAATVDWDLMDYAPAVVDPAQIQFYNIFTKAACSTGVPETNVQATSPPATTTTPVVDNGAGSGNSGSGGNNDGDGTTAAPTGECSFQPAHASKADHSPTLNDEMSFFENYMTVAVLAPLVTNRTYSNITFLGATGGACSLTGPSSYWTQGANYTETCADVFTVSMPWNKHSDCGFVVDTTMLDTNVHVYHNKIIMKYVDHFQTDMGIELTRRTTVSYSVYVSFEKSVEATMDDLSINASVKMRQAFTSFDYNSQSVLGWTSILSWPYMLMDTINLTVPNGTVIDDAAVVGNSLCPTSLSSSCRQSIDIRDDYLAHTCNYSGNYTLSFTVVACRENVESCTKTDVSVQFTLVNAETCGSVSAEPVLKGELVAVNAPEYYFVGDIGTFATELTTTDRIFLTYELIYVTDLLTNDTTTLFNTATHPGNAGITDEGASVSISVNSGYPEDGDVTFSLQYTSDVFKVDPMKSRLYSLTAVSRLRYEGNELYKRTVENDRIDMKTTTASVRSSFKFDLLQASMKPVVADVAATENTPSTSPTFEISNATAIIISTIVLCAVMIVGVIVLVKLAKKGNNNNYSHL